MSVYKVDDIPPGLHVKIEFYLKPKLLICPLASDRLSNASILSAFALLTSDLESLN